ncbi:hypothetical protein [Thalassolituus sp.]|uniref:hypothetical protein n=1 Tax=Thalassolituus sp. TaxID=2030822 RepID=UPI00351685EA
MKNVTSYRVNSALAASKKSITSVFWGTALMLGALSAYSDVPFPAVPMMPVAPVVPEFPLISTPPVLTVPENPGFDGIPLPENYEDQEEYESDARKYARNYYPSYSRMMNDEEFYAAQAQQRAYLNREMTDLPILFYRADAQSAVVSDSVPFVVPAEPEINPIFLSELPLPLSASYSSQELWGYPNRGAFPEDVCTYYTGEDWCSSREKDEALEQYLDQIQQAGYDRDFYRFRDQIENDAEQVQAEVAEHQEALSEFHRDVARYEKNSLVSFYKSMVNSEGIGSSREELRYCTDSPWVSARQYGAYQGESTVPYCDDRLNEEPADYSYLYATYDYSDDDDYRKDPRNEYYSVYGSYDSDYLSDNLDGYAFKEWKEFVPVMQQYQVQMEALAILLLEDISVLPAIPAIPQSYPVPPYPAYLVDDPDDGFMFRRDQGGPVDLDDILYSRDPHYIVYYRKWLRYQGHLDAFGKAMQDYYAGWGAYRDAIGQFMAEEEEARRLKETGAIDLHTIGCEISHGKCFVYTELTYGPVQCSDNILQWTHLAPNGDETLSLLLAGFVSGTKVNFGITDQCLDGYPTFDYFNSLKYYVEENEYTPDQQIEKDVFLGQMISAAGEIYKQKYSGSQNFSGRSVDSIGCLAASNDCFFYTDSPVGPAACSSTAVAWDSTSAGSDQVMSLLMAAQATGKKININTASACYDQDTPTFNYIEMLNQ